MATKEKQTHFDDFKWSIDNEISLFEAMSNYKVVGSNRFFNMALILEKLSEMNKVIPVDNIWSHIESMYDIDTLGEMETVHVTTEDFMLPTADFSDMIKNRSNSEESNKSTNKLIHKPKVENKESPKPVAKRDDRISKVTPRRDSTYSSTPKAVVKMELDKKSAIKSRSRKNSEISLSPNPNNANRIGRSTRGSLKPEDNTPTRSRSPISNIKRRTRTDLK